MFQCLVILAHHRLHVSIVTKVTKPLLSTSKQAKLAVSVEQDDGGGRRCEVLPYSTLTDTWPQVAT